MSWRNRSRGQPRSSGNRLALTTPGLVAHFFRHEYGRLVSLLSCRVGVHNLETVEDAVQTAMLNALATWPRTATPDNPAAWLYQVARNELIGQLRQTARRQHLLHDASAAETAAAWLDADVHLQSEVQDELLRMLFVCCDDAIPLESQLVLALKTLCGFEIREIALRLFTSEANVYKRLARARDRLRQLPADFIESLNPAAGERLRAVQRILYLLFTEGYLSNLDEAALRRELCDEAIRLATLLADHPWGQVPETYALLALMHLHAARAGARQDATGGLLLLEEQDRSLWDRGQIHQGLAWLEKSAQGEHFSRYHAEAGIAAEHCLAPTFTQTRWANIVECYLLLEQAAPSPLHRLNRAVAVAEWLGPAAGLAVLDGFAPPPWLEGSHLWCAVLADLHRRRGDAVAADRYHALALGAAPTPAIQALLRRRLHHIAIPGGWSAGVP